MVYSMIFWMGWVGSSGWLVGLLHGHSVECLALVLCFEVNVDSLCNNTDINKNKQHKNVLQSLLCSLGPAGAANTWQYVGCGWLEQDKGIANGRVPDVVASGLALYGFAAVGFFCSCCYYCNCCHSCSGMLWLPVTVLWLCAFRGALFVV